MLKKRLTAALLAALTLLSAACGQSAPAGFRQKADRLWRQIQTSWDRGLTAPAGEAGHVVFFSLCDGTSRAQVCSGTGETLEDAWTAAVRTAENLVQRDGLRPIWVKADAVCASETVSSSQLGRELVRTREQFFFQGLALDPAFSTAFLEAEMNGARLYDYENGAVNLHYLNYYLQSAGRRTVDALPEEYILFRCRSWFSDEDDSVYELIPDGPDTGRRRVERLDSAYAEKLVLEASAYLSRQVQEDGSFLYGRYPRFGNEIDSYNIVRHAGTVWALLLAYRLSPDGALAESIQKAADYLVSQTLRDSRGRAFILEEKNGEIKLGSCAVAVLALTEYMDVFQDDTYREVCLALGDGILSLLDQSTGEYYHVLNSDFSRKEAFRTVYYDGEATFALCRLYGLTGDSRWLNAACAAADHFIAAGYTQYRDHWVSYSMNEITKYVTDNPDYWTFAMDNALDNLEQIRDLDVTSPICLELLLSAFETYDRAADDSLLSPEERAALLETIRLRADRMLSGFFYPEYAMYMANPQQILGSFMVRSDGFRVRIDDVQHSIGGYCLYLKHYDRLVENGLLS